MLPTVRITVTPRNRPAICSVLSVQLSASTTMRSGTRLCAGSALSALPIEASSLCTAMSTSIPRRIPVTRPSSATGVQPSG
jgi:hypothetical protein